MSAYWVREDGTFAWNSQYQVPWQWVQELPHPVTGEPRDVYQTRGGTFSIYGVPPEFAACTTMVRTFNGGFEHRAMKAPNWEACADYDES